MGILGQLWHSVWAANTLPGRIIVIAVCALAFASWRAFRTHWARYRREEQELGRVIDRLRDWRREEVETTDATGEEEAYREAEGPDEPEGRGDERADGEAISDEGPLVDLGELKSGLTPGSLALERLTAIETLRAHRVRINVDTLHELAVARDEAEKGLGFPAFAGGMSMLLGILGTFFGLAIMVQRIQLGLPGGDTTVSLESWSQSIENLRTVLGGMETAFSTSLLGIAAALVSRSQDYRLRGARVRFFERFERFTARELLPVSVPAVDDESLLERVTFQLERSFQRLDSLHQQNRRAVAQLTGAQQGFSTIVEEIRAITRGEAARDLDQVVEQLAATNRSVLQVVEQLPAVGSVVRRSARELVERVEAPLHGATRRVGFDLPPAAKLVAAIVAALVVIWLWSRSS